LNEKELALPSEAALGFVLRVDMVDGGFDKAKDMCDHFTCNPNNTGWTSAGGGEFFLKKFAWLYRPRLLPKMSGEFR
jgi:hypothetical protein